MIIILEDTCQAEYSVGEQKHPLYLKRISFSGANIMCNWEYP